MRSLVPFKSRRTEVTPAAINLPPAVKEGLKDLLVCFASQPQGDDDKVRLARNYGEAVSGFDPVVAAEAIGRLKLHNPRNPFRPSPQDVYECCCLIMKTWQDSVVSHFIRGVPWADRSDRMDFVFIGQERGRGMRGTRWVPLGSSPPLSDGCIIPDALVLDFLSDYLSGVAADSLAESGAERLDAIPTECFLPGQREKVNAAIAERMKREATRDRCVALIDYLKKEDYDLGDSASFFVEQHGGLYECTLSDAEILAKARYAVEAQREAAARRQAAKLAEQQRGDATFNVIARLGGIEDVAARHEPLNLPRMSIGREKFAALSDAERKQMVAAELAKVEAAAAATASHSGRSCATQATH